MYGLLPTIVITIDQNITSFDHNKIANLKLVTLYTAKKRTCWHTKCTGVVLKYKYSYMPDLLCNWTHSRKSIKKYNLFAEVFF